MSLAHLTLLEDWYWLRIWGHLLEECETLKSMHHGLQDYQLVSKVVSAAFWPYWPCLEVDDLIIYQGILRQAMIFNWSCVLDVQVSNDFNQIQSQCTGIWSRWRLCHTSWLGLVHSWMSKFLQAKAEQSEDRFGNGSFARIQNCLQVKQFFSLISLQSCRGRIVHLEGTSHFSV